MRLNPPSNIHRPKRALTVAVLCVLSLWQAATDAAGYELSRGRQILLNRGLQVQALVYPYIGFTDWSRWRSSNFTGINNGVWAAAWVPGEMPEGQTWSRWYEPDYPTTKYLQSDELQYASKLLSYQYGDELPSKMGNEAFMADTALLNDMKQTYANWRGQYPNVIAYTNFQRMMPAPADLATYMSTTQPDMIMFDYYTGSRALPDDYNFDAGTRNDWYNVMATYRTAGLAGNDGAGQKPIPYAQWLDLYRGTYTSYDTRLPSESFVRLQENASWAFGFTFVTAYLYNEPNPGYGNSHPVIFGSGGDTSPTPVFNYVAEANRQSRNLGPALVRLVSTDIRMIPGRTRHSFLGYHWYVENDVPDGMDRWAPGAGGDSYITGVTPLGGASLEEGEYSDVLIGYFAPLLSDNSGCTFVDGQTFMIVNGASGTSFLPGEAGDPASASAEWYRIDFDFAASGFDSLVRLSRDTGQIELVTLTNTGGSNYYLDLNLPGGTGDLFAFWNSSDPLPTIPEPGALILLTSGLIGALAYAWRRGKM